MKSGTASVITNNHWSKQEACFAHVTQVWLTVNSVLHGQVSLATVNQIYVSFMGL